MKDSHPFPKKIKHYDGMVLKFKVHVIVARQILTCTF